MNQQQQQQRAAEREARYAQYKRMTLTELMEHARTAQHKAEYKRQLETAQTALQLELPVHSTHSSTNKENC